MLTIGLSVLRIPLVRLVEDRDRGCGLPGAATAHRECHHSIHWAERWRNWAVRGMPRGCLQVRFSE